MNRFARMSCCALFLLAGLGAHAGDLSAQQRALHVLNRLGYGPRPGDIERVVAMGVERYIGEQLNPQTIALPATLTQRLDALPIVKRSAGDVLEEFITAQRAGKQGDEAGLQKRRETYQRITEQTAQARLLRAIDSPRQLEEVMVEFWFNHFNVFAGKGLDRALVSSYERDAIRPYALGKFRDLLGATAKHPAMLFYLDNWLSVAPGYQTAFFRPQAPAAKSSGLNENYARELMELHTLGVDGGYTQKDVTELARILTGWTFAPRELVRSDTTFRFDDKRHDQGDKEWLGYHVSARGQNEGEWALDQLVAHPATARFISYQLAQYFVADEPPKPLVERLSQRFLATRGDIREVLRTLFASPEFWDAGNVGSKFKTPYQFVLSAVRATALDVVNVRPLLGTLAQLGMPLYGCPTPDGYKNTEAAWLNPEALTRRINFATALASGRLPLAQAAGTGSGPGKGDQTGPATPVDASQLLATLGPVISGTTRQTVANTQRGLQAALLLGSPDFMRR